MSVLSDYQVRFYYSDLWAGKRLKTINDMLTVYIGDHYTLSRANQLLDILDSFVNGQSVSSAISTQSLYLAYVTQTETKIYQDLEAWEEDNNIAPDFVLPTTDFKVIVEAWRDYLAS